MWDRLNSRPLRESELLRAHVKRTCGTAGLLAAALALPACSDGAKSALSQPFGTPQSPKLIADHQRAAIAAAENFERLLLAAHPHAEKLISSVNIAGRDKHLTVHMKEAFLVLTPEQGRSLEHTIGELWRSTKYVEELKWGGTVEFYQHDGDRSALHWDSPSAPAAKAEEPTDDPAPGTRRVGELIDPRPQAKIDQPEPAPKKRKRVPTVAAKAAEEEARKRSARADALLRSATLLEKQGETAGAVTFYRDIERDFAETEASAKAAKRIKALEQRQ